MKLRAHMDDATDRAALLKPEEPAYARPDDPLLPYLYALIEQVEACVSELGLLAEARKAGDDAVLDAMRAANDLRNLIHDRERGRI